MSDRVAFLRKTYGLLGVALIAWAAITAGMMTYMQTTSLKFASFALGGAWNWLIILGAFMGVGWVAQRLAMSETSRGLQYVGLLVAVLAEALIVQPLLWIAILKFGPSGGNELIMQAGLITMVIFGGLTATVFITKKDFSFMRGALTIASFAFLGIILASLLFGFHLGGIFAGIGILLMSGYILYYTSVVMKEFPPTAHVSAALILFSTIATLFWYVLQLLMSLRNN
ncbi:MAG: Bax inhibitor-1 family protein [Kofleriaceae bacterium]